MLVDARETLQRLCAEREVDFAGLSRLVGRNPAYIQQFVRRGTPRRLPETERRVIADFFGVPESLLGGPAPAGPLTDGMIAVPLLGVRAAAGAGSVVNDERPRAHMSFDQAWLRRLTSAKADQLSLLQVSGDSMAPTLTDGDELLIDRSDSAERLRDGVYVMRIEDMLVVKRLTLHPVTRRVTVQSDNPSYADWPDCDPSELDIIGRVIWTGRRVS
jgi:phage repressor protein C with HTH and peptisase S24 domain